MMTIEETLKNLNLLTSDTFKLEETALVDLRAQLCFLIAQCDAVLAVRDLQRARRSRNESGDQS